VAFGANLKTSTINFGTGAFAYADNWYAGIAAPQLLKNAITSYSGGVQKPSYEIQHIFLQGGYIYELNPLIDIKPNALIKYVAAAPLSIDLNVNVYYQKMFGVGLGYRTGKSAVAMLECQVHPWFKIAYAYDRMLSSMGTFTGSSHEFMLRYTMNQKGIQNSPRLY
jgi:type IX secretion system PorP/SprF family membrane protein